MALLAADVDSYFRNEKFSDVALVLQEEDSRKRKRQSIDGETETDCITLPGHSMVLLGYSPYFKTKVRTCTAGRLDSLAIRRD